MWTKADIANTVLLTFSGIGIGLAVLLIWNGLRYFFLPPDNYRSPTIRDNTWKRVK